MMWAHATALGVSALLIVIGLDSTADAQQTGRWKLAEGHGKASATLYSINTLTTGTRTIDYHPALVVSCEARRYPVWRQEVLVHRAISGENRIAVTLRFDNGGSFDEEWTLADMNRSLRSDGDHAVARLARARRFRITWRFGVFSGTGEAIFDTAGIRETLGRLAQSCGTDVP